MVMQFLPWDVVSGQDEVNDDTWGQGGLLPALQPLSTGSWSAPGRARLQLPPQTETEAVLMRMTVLEVRGLHGQPAR